VIGSSSAAVEPDAPLADLAQPSHSNVVSHLSHAAGDVDSAFARADNVVR
jgi:hypothetical protein